MAKTPAQLDAEIAAALTRSPGGQTAIPSPPSSVRTDRQRKNWYWRKWQAAEKHATAVARDHGVDTLAYRNARAVSEAFEREWEWYSALLQGEDL